MFRFNFQNDYVQVDGTVGPKYVLEFTSWCYTMVFILVSPSSYVMTNNT